MSFFHNAKSMFDDFSSKLGLDDKNEQRPGEHTESHHSPFHHLHIGSNRYKSFAPPRTGNNAKWYVDGCTYMWAISMALENAKESIFILDWWLSPGRFDNRECIGSCVLDGFH